MKIEVKVIADGKTFEHVEVVQGASTTMPRFIKLPDGWVRDLSKGLDWGPSSNKGMNYADAEKYCISKGGRMPNVNELFSLIDRTKENPAVDNGFFPDTKNDYYWTNEKTIWNTSARWVVGFSGGLVYDGNEDDYDYARPVRPSQC